MTEKVQISFEGSGVEGSPPLVTIHNSEVLSPGLARQIARYGITRRANSPGQVSGYLQGARKDFLAMVQSYGVGIEIMRKQPPAAVTFE
jgi:hypothetical protein